MDKKLVEGIKVRMPSFQADFDGIMPGTDQDIYDIMNRKARRFEIPAGSEDKGVFVRVLSEEEMPRDAQGRPAELIVNNLPHWGRTWQTPYPCFELNRIRRQHDIETFCWLDYLPMDHHKHLR